MSSSNVQLIYNNLTKISNLQKSIKNPHLDPNIQSCLKLMNNLTLYELGIGKSVSLQGFHEPVCMEICSVPKFSLAVFILPAGSRLPVHDHPQMSVLCKLVSGSLSYRSFTAELSSKEETLYDCTEVVKTNADSSWYLTPNRGNFHELTAHENCVLFDALLPPYREPERPCSYYHATQSTGQNGKWRLDKLEEDMIPYDLLPYGIPYLGDRIIL
jgi:plant cysteine oxidase